MYRFRIPFVTGLFIFCNTTFHLAHLALNTVPGCMLDVGGFAQVAHGRTPARRIAARVGVVARQAAAEWRQHCFSHRRLETERFAKTSKKEQNAIDQNKSPIIIIGTVRVLWKFGGEIYC